MKKLLITYSLLLIPYYYASAQLNVLFNFTDTTYVYPEGDLTLSGGLMYGMTAYGGVNSNGCIFSINIFGHGFTDLYDFTYTQGAFPYGSLTLSGTTIYGMTRNGGLLHDSGCIFSIQNDGSYYKVLLNFNDTNGAFPYGSLTLVGNKLFGMTSSGGAHDSGCVFSLDTSGGGYLDLHDFSQADGKFPHGSLTLLGNKLYGMTSAGGTNDSGCVFSLDTNGGGYKDLYNFTGPNGATPYGSLTPALTSGILYGMTTHGGTNHFGSIFSFDTSGSSFTNLFYFGLSNGAFPFGSLTLTGDTLYGMAGAGGLNNLGNIFSINTNGSKYRTHFDFNGSNGALPHGSLTLAGNILYGMTTYGGPNDAGLIFSCNDTITGINQLPVVSGSALGGSVYPNPSDGIFTFSIRNEELGITNKNIEVYNLLGEIIETQCIAYLQTIHNSQFTIDLGNQPSGIYFYRIVAEDGGMIGEGKVVIQK